MSELKEMRYEEIWILYMAVINRVEELRHKAVMSRQISKFNKLLQLKIAKTKTKVAN